MKRRGNHVNILKRMNNPSGGWRDYECEIAEPTVSLLFKNSKKADVAEGSKQRRQGRKIRSRG